MKSLRSFIRSFYLTAVFGCFAWSATGQDSARLERQFQKYLEKGQWETLTRKANKTLAQQPDISVPRYYLSRVAYAQYQSSSQKSFATRWGHLQQALHQASEVAGAYPAWVAQLRSESQRMLEAQHASGRSPEAVKQALGYYTEVFADTLSLYHQYFLKNLVPKTHHAALLADSLRYRLITFASSLVGTPYRYAGESPKTGFDCSGFTRYVFSHIGIELPHSSQLQSTLAGDTLSLEEAQPGDLIFFGRRTATGWVTQHAGIFYGRDELETKVIHCASTGVRIDGQNSSWESYWKDRVLFVKRLPGLSTIKELGE